MYSPIRNSSLFEWKSDIV